jgi:transposase
MRPKGTTIQLEVRRRVAVSLLAAGWGVRHAARHVKASPSSVRRWRDAVAQHPETGRDATPHPGGSPPKLRHKRPERLIYDKAWDSDALRQRLARRGIDLICPHRTNRKRPPMQDGRKLRRDKRRWKVERTFAWVGNFRRLVVRWERDITMYRAFFHVACLLITLKKL